MAEGAQVRSFTLVVTHVSDTTEAWALPTGTTVGDTCGGRSFSDNVAEVLESRSLGGWYEISEGEKRWTLIALAR